MGAFYLVRRDNDNMELFSARCEALSKQMALQGFDTPKKLQGRYFDVFVYPKQNHPGENYIEYEGGDFCACVGTLIYQGQSGASALDCYFRDFRPEAPPGETLYGAFCLIVQKNGKLFLLSDRLGVYKVYHGPQAAVWSSSFLGVAGTLQNPHINLQAVYEFVFQGATYGNETVFRDVQLLDCDAVYRLDREVQPVARGGRLRAPQLSRASMAGLLEENLSALGSLYQGIAGCFGDAVDTALSGGYDSRLTLALLKAQGLSPSVHVYGKSTDIDVRVAREVDRGEGLGLEHVDKSTFPRVPEEAFSEIVETNHYVFDGCPTDGIFNNGSDLETRRQRCATGTLMLNGGGGEVFRNFYYLPDKRYSVRQLLWTFYSQFDPGVTTAAFDEEAYYRRLEKKILDVLGTEDVMLSRTEVELVYPLFRCRYWMGKNNSVNNRLGYALTPFIDYEIVKRAIRIPLKYKNHGRFEAALIQAVSPALAAYASAYGHNFSGPPGLRHRLSDQLTLRRPTRLRRYLYRIKARRLTGERPYPLDKAYLETVMDAQFPYLGELFRVQANRDNAQYNRMCTLEYLFQKTSAQLPG